MVKGRVAMVHMGPEDVWFGLDIEADLEDIGHQNMGSGALIAAATRPDLA